MKLDRNEMKEAEDILMKIYWFLLPEIVAINKIKLRHEMLLVTILFNIDIV